MIFLKQIWAIWTATRENFPEDKSSKIVSLFKLDSEWGPKSPKLRKEWLSYKAERLEKRRAQSLGHSKLKKISNILLGNYD